MVPALNYFGLLSDFSILFALQLVHSIVSRDSLFLSLVPKTLCGSLLLTHYFWTISHSKQRSPWFRFCFTLHPHSGCAFQVSNFPLRWSISSQTCLCSWFPTLPRNSPSSVFCIVNFTLMFQPKGHVQNVFSFPSPPKNFYSARWLHSTLEIPQWDPFNIGL